jgi:tripartite ATP-independent transporter DctM subunit
MSIEVMSALLFGSLLLALASGLPLVFVLGGLGVVFTYFLWGPEALFAVGGRTFRLGTNFLLLAIPLFIFMGQMLMKSGIADALYGAMHHWIGGIRGGLAMGTVWICALFAAMAGISGAATITVGTVALPSMLKRDYDKAIAMGSISAGGALGILIPPSTVMIILALFAELSVGRLFLGGVLSGLTLASLFVIYIGVRALVQPGLGPPVPPEERVTLREKFYMLRSLILPILLIITVLGSIFSGAATPTEAAGIGALGSIICTAVLRRLTWRNLLEACYSSLRLSCMVMWIIFGAGIFTALYSAVGAHDLVGKILLALPGGSWGVIIGMQVILIILGMFLDPAGIIMITIPIFIPLVRELGFDPIWFGVLFTMNMEMAFLTPPLGFNLFYMRGIAPKSITMGDIYRSITPFVMLQAVGLALVMVFPQIALWLPNLVLG